MSDAIDLGACPDVRISQINADGHQSKYKAMINVFPAIEATGPTVREVYELALRRWEARRVAK